MRCGQPLHRDREDVPRAPLGLVPRLALDLLQPQRGLVAGLLLDVRDEDLLGLRGAQSRDPLQFAPLDALRALELLGLLLDVALAVLEGLKPPVDVGSLHPEGLGLAQGALLHPRDLRAASLKLVAGAPRRRALAAIVACGRMPPPGL